MIAGERSDIVESVKKGKVFLLLLGSLVVVGYGLVFGLVSLAGNHARELVGLVLGGYERFTMTYTESLLAHLSRMDVVRRLDQNSCKFMQADLEQSQGFLAVLALGDAEGNPVCTADPLAKQPLPTMADRPYYHKVKVSEGLVVGDYAVSKTTGEQVLHFAYPIREGDKFLGFVLASVNLEWFVDERVDQYLGGRGVQVLGIDGRGQMLYSYPKDAAGIGEQVVSPDMIAAMVAGEPKYQVMRGHDGVYRVYGYKVISGESENEILFLAGVSLEGFRSVMVGVLGFMVLAAGISWYAFSRLWVKEKATTKKK